MAWNVLSPSLAARVAATLVAVSVFAALFVRVITDQHRRLEALAITDPLTGPMDRAPLAAVLDDAVAQHERSGVPVSLVALDVDHFKGINDTFGHDVGDEVLQRVGILLQARKRRTDRIFRLGGEEFLLVLKATDGPGAVRVDDELRTAIEREPSWKAGTSR